MLKEFKAWILRGNVIDLAVAVVIGVAFGTVVSSFVRNLLTPLISIPGTTNFANLDFAIRDSVFAYGAFLNDLASFALVAAAIFFVIVKPLNKLAARKPEAVVDITTRECPECLSQVPKGAHRCSYCTSQLAPVQS